MLYYTESQIPALDLQIDQSFSSRVMKKYNWTFATEKRVKLEHKHEQEAKSKADSKVVFSPQIHLQQTITPLHLNIIIKHLKFSQIPIYKQQLLVSPSETIQRKNNIYIQNNNSNQTQQVKLIEQKNIVTQHKNTATPLQQIKHEHEHNITQLKHEHHVHLQQVDELHQNHVQMIQQQNNKQLQVIEHVHYNEQKRVQATIVQRMENLVEHYENKHKHIHVTSTILEQLLPYFREDKLLTQLKQHYEQRTYRVNATIQQHRHNIYKTVHHSLLQSGEHDHPTVDVEQRNSGTNMSTPLQDGEKQSTVTQRTTNNTVVNHALSLVQKPLIYNWHKRVGSLSREATSSSLFSTSEVQSAKQQQTTLQPIQLESTKLEHRQISKQSDLRNLLNIRRTVEEKHIKLTVQQQNQLKTIQLASKSNPVSLFTRAITVRNEKINRTELINKDSSHQTFEPSIHIPSDESNMTSAALNNQEAESAKLIRIVQQQNNVLNPTLQHALSSQHIVVNNIQSESMQAPTKRGRGRPKKNVNTTSIQVNGIEQNVDAIAPSSTIVTEHVIDQKPLHLTYKENQSVDENEQLNQASEHKVAERVRETILQTDMKLYAERLKKRYQKQNQPMKLILEKINVVSKIEHLSKQEVVVNNKFVKATTRQLKQTIKREVINEAQLLHHNNHIIDNHSQLNETVLVQREHQQTNPNQVVVNNFQVHETQRLARKLVVKDINSNITQVDVQSLKRQVIRQDNPDTGLFVKQQHNEGKTVSSNQVEQLRQQVKMLETQLEQQYETLKQSNQRINLKQLSNQVYEELLRKIKFEKQRLGR